MTIRHFTKNGEYRHYKCEGDTILATVEIAGIWRSNPQVAELEADGWEEYIQPAPQPYVPTYEEKVVYLIRERYDQNDELKYARWSRHIDTLTDEQKAEIDAFDEYVEWCHEEAKKND